MTMDIDVDLSRQSSKNDAEPDHNQNATNHGRPTEYGVLFIRMTNEDVAIEGIANDEQSDHLREKLAQEGGVIGEGKLTQEEQPLRGEGWIDGFLSQKKIVP